MVDRDEALPPDVAGLNLQIRDLSFKGLTAVPVAVLQETNLHVLDLRGNELTALTPEIAQLSNLRALDLRSNKLTALTPEIAQLSNLRVLDLDDNKLTVLPAVLAPLLRNGLRLGLRGNPLRDPLPDLISRGSDALAAYLASLDEGDEQFEAKVMLVGEGNVGKTSLVASLRGEDFEENKSTTHGIEVVPLNLPHPSRDVKMAIQTWDFGGQEVYRITHQFFFTRHVLYLMVWKPREGQEQNEVEWWLRRIRLRVDSDFTAIVVATHSDEHHSELDFPLLEQKLPGMLAGQYSIDNRSRNGVAELRDKIAEIVAGLPHMGQVLNRRWTAARDDIRSLAKSEQHIPYEKFVAICRRHYVIGNEVTTLVNLLHDLGQVVYYGEDDGLRDHVVLNPEWLTKPIARVLEDELTRKNKGILDHARLTEIWQRRPDGSGYETPYHPYFLRLMEKFDVSYRLADSENHSLVAQLVPYERPELPWEVCTPVHDGKRAISLICELDEPAPGLMAWLTVRHHNASIGKHWRRGVFLRHPTDDYDSEALLELRNDNLTQLVLEVRAPSPDMFFNVLRDSVENLMRTRWPGLRYELLVPCPGRLDGAACHGKFPLLGLQKLRERQMPGYSCLHCNTDHDVSQLLTGFPAPTRSPQPVLELLYQKISSVSEEMDSVFEGVKRVETINAEIADSVRKIMKAVGTEVTDCPRLFTLTSERPTGFRRIKSFFEMHYILTLWCEHPDHWHICPTAQYHLHHSKNWLVDIAPYVQLVLKTLRVALPVAAAVVDLAIPKGRIEQGRDGIQLMATLVDKLPMHEGGYERDSDSRDLREGPLSPVEGRALRSFRALLFQNDLQRAFGGLRRVQAPAGEFLWVCEHHYPEYDPGLPKIPTY